jgi:hypothetical protein
MKLLFLSLVFSPFLANAQMQDAESKNFFTENPNLVMACSDPAARFGNFEVTLNDSEWLGKNTVTISNHSMPYTQKVEVQKVVHEGYTEDYLISTSLSQSSTCIGFQGGGMTLPYPTDCDSAYYRSGGTLNFVVKPIVIFMRERESDQGTTVGSYVFSMHGEQSDQGLMLCQVNFLNLKKLLK